VILVAESKSRRRCVCRLRYTRLIDVLIRGNSYRHIARLLNRYAWLRLADGQAGFYLLPCDDSQRRSVDRTKAKLIGELLFTPGTKLHRYYLFSRLGERHGLW